ncbi:uncharacterized protein LOC128921895 [Zeugodacus cucurbitae]|uniref:uncharacterized protein LOC128921895 n=1 Tax=Zeugodacus cucurbitae TaxID=28588 RepID=UPI0023D95EBE|nr:uncharacterized protein LOC128921895 [Zeugodacus cucurbitae]
MKILAFILYMFVASANSGYTLAGSTFNDGFDFDGDFGKDGWHGLSQDLSDGEKTSLSAEHKDASDIGDYGGVFGSGKPITEVMQEEGEGVQGDYGKFTEFTEDGGSLGGGDGTGWYGFSGGNSDFSEHNQAEKVVREEAGTGGLGSFRTPQPHDALGTHGDLGEFSAGQSIFDSYVAVGEYKSHFGVDQFGEDHFDQEVKGFQDEGNNEGTTNFNQFGGFEDFLGQQEYKISKDIHADDDSHGYHEYGGFSTANGGFDHTGFEGFENEFGGYKSGDGHSDVA